MFVCDLLLWRCTANYHYHYHYHSLHLPMMVSPTALTRQHTPITMKHTTPSQPMKLSTASAMTHLLPTLSSCILLYYYLPRTAHPVPTQHTQGSRIYLASILHLPSAPTANSDSTSPYQACSWYSPTLQSICGYFQASLLHQTRRQTAL